MREHPPVSRLLVLALLVGVAPVAEAGSPAPAPVERFGSEVRGHWAFRKLVTPPIPSVVHAAWVRNPVDAFVLAGLEAKGLEPAPEADVATLLRRASLDLLGLPPSPDVLSPGPGWPGTGDRFPAVVDQLLASPHYGERWGRHWLDLARYADSEGFKSDETRPHVWRYRDYVIQALNADKPYDRFLQEQIAGDELWPRDPVATVATAFSRHYADESNARNLAQRRQEILDDVTDTVGSVFLGLSYGCARCHDHKFDPILQTDYYRLQAFFANTAARDDVPLASVEELALHRERLAEWEGKTAAVRAELKTLAAPHRKAILKDFIDKYPDDIRRILDKPEVERTPFERQMAWKARQYIDPASHEYLADDGAVAGHLKGEEKQRWEELHRRLKAFDSLKPPPLEVASAMMDLGEEAPKTFLLRRGLYDSPREEVQPGLLEVLYPTPAAVRPPGAGTTRRRTALAELLTSPDNPLTSRVIVNRVWQYHFGRGLVGTPSDFGLRGDRPTHPELLDWLAADFMAHGWSLKHLHRIIMGSATYRQASVDRAEASRVDPDNRLLGRFPRHRLEAETIRDVELSVAGLLNPRMGGPGIFPELPDGMPAPRGGWRVNEDPSERNRRSVYVFIRRNTRYPMFDSFDMPDPHESCPRRNVTTSPLQALTLLNSRLTLDWARGFAGRVLEAAGRSEELESRVEIAFRMALNRPPDPSERRSACEFLRQQSQLLTPRLARQEPVALPLSMGPEVEPAGAAALVDLCHVLLNTTEFVYVN